MFDNGSSVIFDPSLEGRKARERLKTSAKFELLSKSDCPVFVLDEFIKDKNIDVACRAIKRVRDIDKLERIARTSRNSSILTAVLSNEFCPKSTVEYLKARGDENISYLAGLQLAFKY